MLEKYSTLTRRGNINRPDGGLTETLSLDDLLTNVMIYWVTNTATTAARVSKETFDFEVENNVQDDRPVSSVLFGYARFPEAIAKPPKEYLERIYPNFVQYTYMPRGGHHSALENPELLSADFRSFFKKTLEIIDSQKA
jgi:microsomal epoxide hydrolase